MNQESRQGSVKRKLLLLNLLLLVAVVAVQLVDSIVDGIVTQNVMHPQFKDQITVGQKMAIKAIVDVEADNLAEKLKDVKTRDDQIKLLIDETDPIRFFDDRTGYFFTYDLTGVRVNVPIDKSQNGLNLIDLVDPKGNHLIKDIVETARNGSGYVEYYFMKPNKVIAPKTSYVKRIPGTEFLIGTGAYTDLDLAVNNIQDKIDTGMKPYSTYRLVAFLGVLALAMVLSMVICRSVARSA